jgi:ketosteroid isomerase-like protein
MATEEALAQEVLAAAERLVGTFGRHDTAAYFAQFTEDATFIFHTVDQVLRSRAAYEELWATWESEEGFHVQNCRSNGALVRVLGNDAAVFTHDVTTVVSIRGEVETLEERETIVFERRGGGWIAVHEHLSDGRK